MALHRKPYLNKPRRGRVEAGTVLDWAHKFDCVDAIRLACTTGLEMNQDLYTHVVSCPVFTGYLGGTAGYCGYRPLYIELHDAILTDEFFSNEGRDTFLHEVGHLIDTIERGESDHSKRWRHVMARLGKPDETRCHTIPRSKMTSARVPLYCDGFYMATKLPSKEKVREKCDNIEHTTKPEKYAGKKCSWCDSGRLQLYKTMSDGSKRP